MPNSEIKVNAATTIEDKDIFKSALDTRNFEISMFWQRSNYFLVLNTALGVGVFKTEWPESLVLALFGFFVSLLWFRVNLGSKYWQSRWEERLAVVELQVAPNLKFFSADWPTINADVERSLQRSNHEDRFRKWLDKQTLKKHSVSYNMTLLSFFFMLGWVILAALNVWRNWPYGC